jgi:hypothetical protein
MRQVAIVLVPLFLLAGAGPQSPVPGEPPFGTAPDGGGRIYHVEYLRALPGKSGDYDRFVKTVFRPMLDAMVARGVWTRYTFLTVPYRGAAPCADYTHIFVAQLRDFAALDGEQAAWSGMQKKFHPDDAERRRLFEEDLPHIRELVREEFLQDFDWK